MRGILLVSAFTVFGIFNFYIVRKAVYFLEQIQEMSPANDSSGAKKEQECYNKHQNNRDDRGEVYLMPESTRERSSIRNSLQDVFKSMSILALATVIGFGFIGMGVTEANVITIYILGVLIISVVTTHRVYSLISSAASVLIFNFFFTVPRFTLRAYDQRYSVTFLVMFLAAFITGTLAEKLKLQAKQSAQAAYRTKILLDTNQLLQQERGKEAIISAMAGQITKLLGKDIVIYPVQEGKLGEPAIYPFSGRGQDKEYVLEAERAAAERVLMNNGYAPATTDVFSKAKCLYYGIRVNSNVYGVVGIMVGGEVLDDFENSVLLSILGECALALENERNAKEKEEAAVLAQNEQLRANLLRAISHDLRTPLTSISGNASNLLSNGERFDEPTKVQIYKDIYDDSMWLVSLVENLLSITRIEEGRMNLNLSTELLDEILEEALQHINRRCSEHRIVVCKQTGFVFVKADARLLIQVIINIIDNAVKYTPAGSEIDIITEQQGDKVTVRIADNGPGIEDELKPRVFDMFYTGANQIADSRRSLGLGLALCKSIIDAHGGTIFVEDNKPQGSVFVFTLPAKEVTVDGKTIDFSC